MTALAGIVFGIFVLIAGGTALIHGASQAAARFGVSPLIVGLTVVAFGTSMPELVVNLIGAWQGQTGLAFGNIIGSNIFNLTVVLGVAALVRPLVLHGNLVRREVPLLMLGTSVLTVLALDRLFENEPNLLGRSDSLVLLLIFGIFIYITVLDVLRSRQRDAILTDIDSSPLIIKETTARYSWLYALLGVALLYGGGELTVNSSVRFATNFQIAPEKVGLFIVAAGTSLPELAASLVAAVRKESDLAVGNVVGSNIFNALMIMPASGLLAEVEIPEGGAADLVFSWFLAALLIPVFVLGHARIGRYSAGVLLSAYAVWVVFRLV